MSDFTVNPIDAFFLQKTEPVKSCLMALRNIIQRYNPHITEEWKYGMPVYCYKGKMLCYLWTNKKSGHPYIGIVKGGKINHPLLVQDNRKRMKVMHIDANADIPLGIITDILGTALALYK